MAYSKKEKIRMVKYLSNSLMSVNDFAEIKKIPKQTIYRWIRAYKKYGHPGLENKKPGKRVTKINESFERLVIQFWNERRSSHKLWIDLRTMGFFVSERQIQKIYVKHNLKMNKRKRPSQIKFVKYEWPRPIIKKETTSLIILRNLPTIKEEL
jgi:transposase